MIIVAQDGTLVNFDNVFGVSARSIGENFQVVAYSITSEADAILKIVNSIEDAKKIFREITDDYANGVKVVYLTEENK